MAGAILLFDFSSFCQFNAKTSTLGAGREIYHRRTIHSTIESWSCIKRTLVHIAKSNREQQQQSSFEETNPFPAAGGGGCGGKQRTEMSHPVPKLRIHLPIPLYSHISKEFNYTQKLQTEEDANLNIHQQQSKIKPIHF